MGTIVNPTFRLDVTGKLFKNKASNKNIQETLFFNDLMTRLSINKGDLVYFPEIGLKQFLGKFNFTDESKLVEVVTEFESELDEQLGRDCRVNYELDPDNKHVSFSIEVDGLEYPVDFVYSGINDSIRIVNPQILSDDT